MRIAINTLYENPLRPTGSWSYNAYLMRHLGEIDQSNEYFVFVSDANRMAFENDFPNFSLVNCRFSNERRPMRILAEQTMIPWHTRRLGIDVLYSPGNTTSLLHATAIVLNIKTMHHRVTPAGLGWSRLLFRDVMMTASARKANLIVANSQSNKRDICTYLKIPQSKVRLIPEGLDHSVFRVIEDRESVDRLLERRGIDKPYILYVSGLWPYKNVETLIDSFALLCHRGLVSVSLIIVGGGYPWYEKSLREKVADLDLEARVQFTGYVPDAEIPLLYNGASTVVLPSKYETFGRVATEAMACGVPLIASNTSSIPEVVHDAGLLVDPSDTEGMAGAIRNVLSDEGLRQELIKKGLGRAQRFSWRKNVQKLHKVFEEAYALYQGGTGSQ